ncbi:hypothetical protein RND71_018082 [Anisodus tanguticus]|uniref:Uncharacterized protein n=1 Tax=Anisodus tanguticus TaxID=243964 RepID=A0AAE1S5E2_9SOLA|nr:hypothetical protein RND71_018082 [Anisodus tanguticus]
MEKIQSELALGENQTLRLSQQFHIQKIMGFKEIKDVRYTSTVHTRKSINTISPLLS